MFFKLNQAQVENIVAILHGYKNSLEAQSVKPGASKELPVWIGKTDNFIKMFREEGKDKLSSGIE